jgi:hypothetical protein
VKAPVLTRLDYDLANTLDRFRTADKELVLVAVDSCKNGTGWVVYQLVNSEKHPAIYGSCTFNKTESAYSQPKCELYSVF